MNQERTDPAQGRHDSKDVISKEIHGEGRNPGLFMRFPRPLHAQIIKEAEDEGMLLQDYIRSVLKRHRTQTAIHRKKVERLETELNQVQAWKKKATELLKSTASRKIECPSCRKLIRIDFDEFNELIHERS